MCSPALIGSRLLRGCTRTEGVRALLGAAQLIQMRLSEFDYVLPEELIAQEPLEQRDSSRLLVVNRSTGILEHGVFGQILDYLRDDDLLVLNDTRVVAGRLEGRKQTGGRVEVLLLRRLEPAVWEAMVKPGRRVGVGVRLLFDRGLSAEVLDRMAAGGRILRFEAQADPEELLRSVGRVPLPPYIRKALEEPERYQTVYGVREGSAAAPTAGLHFTPELLEKIDSRGIKRAYVTLHVGLATFRPVRTEHIDEHEMHKEYFEISDECARQINSAKGRIVCVGTTTARALESAAVGRRRVEPVRAETDLFIRPPHDFKIVEALVTNFHMPRSTLLIMISAFAGIELIRSAYREAVSKRYRFLSFGDAMFIH